MSGKMGHKNHGITLLGLGPGDPNLITREAWDWLAGLEFLYLRTKDHPAVASLPAHLRLVSFDDIIDEGETTSRSCL